MQTAAAPAATPTERTRSTRRPNRLTRSELAVAWLLLVVLGVAVFTSHIRDGGFYLDDWSNGALALHPRDGGFANAFSAFWDLTSYRPVLVLYVPLTYKLFGTHMGLHLAWAAALSIGASGILYGLLRTLALERLHAWAIAALVLVYPWSDSTRLWATASQVSLSMVWAFGGLWAALVGLERRSWRWHALAVLLYVLSVLTYEVTIPLLALAGTLYIWKGGWSVAWRRWLGDVVAIAASAAWVGTHTKRESFGIEADLRHLRWIVESGATMLGRSVTAVGAQRTATALILLAVVGLAAATAWRTLGPERAESREALRWLIVGLSGVALALLGWLMFVPADPYYTPAIWGVTNRVNGLAAVGLVITVYAATAAVGHLASLPFRRHRRWVAMGVTASLAVVLGATYVHVFERHAQIWDTAFRAEIAGIGQVKTQFPTLPHGTVVLTAGYPANETLGVPIFSTTWDVNGMVKLQYHDGSLAGYPVVEGIGLRCAPTGVALTGAGDALSRPFPYGSVRLLNVSTGEHTALTSVADCRRETPRYAPGPTYLHTTY